MPTLSTLVGILLCTYFAAVRTLPKPSPESNKPRSRPKVLSFSPVLSAQPCHLPPYTILRKSCPLGSTPLPSCISSELGLNCTVRATVEPGDETIRTMRGVCGCRVAHPPKAAPLKGFQRFSLAQTACFCPIRTRSANSLQ